MQAGLLKKEKPYPLPDDFQPSQWDITIPCGWVKSKERSGNVRFLEMCEQELETYEKCSTKHERSEVLHRIVLAVVARSPTQTGFVNKDKSTGKWHFIGMTRARERVGYVLRRAIADKNAKREMAQNGAFQGATSNTETSPQTRKTKSQSFKTQERTGLVWSISAALSKLDSEVEESAEDSRSRKFCPSSFEKYAVSPKRRRIALGAREDPLQRTVSPTIEDEQASSPDNGGIKEAIAIAKSSALLLESSLPGAASLPSSLHNGLTGVHATRNDIYLEAAIREHAAWRERLAVRESSTLRELTACRQGATDPSLREHSTIRERLALHENAILRERLAMHESAAVKKHRDMGSFKVSDAIAAAKSSKQRGLGASLTPAECAIFLRSAYPSGVGGGTSFEGMSFAATSGAQTRLPASLYAEPTFPASNYSNFV